MQGRIYISQLAIKLPHNLFGYVYKVPGHIAIKALRLLFQMS